MDAVGISDDSVQRPAGGGKCVELPLHRRIIHQRWGVKRFDPGIDYKSAAALPVPPADFGRRVGAGKDHPAEVVQGRRREHAVIADHDQWKAYELVTLAVETAELLKKQVALAPTLA